ncbi:hypothetical protein ACRQ5Q_14865 [Bradyrhizobium sp. PMVTL-01]|uniref:hypothetical protein n=1 Tax=Bradyrhizobium sp. PMVTL-01 TaxID=3434999 RepID=UPI003F723AE8
MIKWIALILALAALHNAADANKVGAELDRLRSRVEHLEGGKCTLMQVLTPSGTATICAIQ